VILFQFPEKGSPDGVNHLEPLFSHAQDGIVIIDEQHKVISANPKFCSMLGYSLDELLSLHTWDYVVGYSEEDIRNNFNLFDEINTTIESEHRRKDGSTFHVEVSITGVNDTPKPLFLGICRDITRRKQAERELLHSQELMRYIIEHSNSAIAVHDRDLHYIFVSQRYLEEYGVSETDVIGKHHYEVFPDLPEKWRKVHQKALRGAVIRQEDDPYPKADGSVEWTSWECRPWYESDGSIGGIIVYTEVITERKKAEEQRIKLMEQIAQTSKMESIGRLAGGVAHDFNNMLGVILGYTEMALDSLPSDHPLVSDLKQIQIAGNRSAELTRQLLTFSRQQQICPQPVDLNSAIKALLSILQRLLGDNLHLNWEPSANACVVKIDPSQVDQIVMNLCTNARESIEDIGEITIKTETMFVDEFVGTDQAEQHPGTYALLSVSDNGRGMNHDTLSHAFEPFYTTKEVGKGTGLGLATVFGIAKQNGGFVSAYSEPEVGTTIKVYLPADKEYEKPLPKEASDLETSGHETILLVDDNEVFRNLTGRMLDQLHYTVILACSAHEAVAIVAKQDRPIDVLLSDVVMPDMNGADLLAELRRYIPHLPCLFMSGYTSNILPHEDALGEHTGFVQKPFSKHELTKKLREVLDSKKDDTLPLELS
ncbi:MAG: PAS domain S-box protein, partial [Spirochaetota bacterium]